MRRIGRSLATKCMPTPTKTNAYMSASGGRPDPARGNAWTRRHFRSMTHRSQSLHKAEVKAAAVVLDDTVVTPRYVVGFPVERELPIVRKIALGSLRNKPALARNHFAIVAENSAAGISKSSASETSKSLMTSPSTRAFTPSTLCGQSRG